MSFDYNVLSHNYKVISDPLEAGMLFKFIMYNHKTGYKMGDFTKEIENWCIDNISDNSLYDVSGTMLGCWVTINDDEYAVAFKLMWTK